MNMYLRLRELASALGLAVAVLMFMPACGQDTQKDANSGQIRVIDETGESKWVDPEDIQPNSHRRATLTDTQFARIEKLQSVFFEIDSLTVDDWVDNFRRDLNPNNELVVWERMAGAFEKYCDANKLSHAGKIEVYRVVLMRSMAPADEVLKRLDLKVLSENDAIEIMNDFAK